VPITEDAIFYGRARIYSERQNKKLSYRKQIARQHLWSIT